MEIENRVSRAEFKIETHEKEIEDLRSRTRQLHYDLAELKTIMNSIKYWLYGMGTFFVINEAGVTEALKKYLGIG